MGVVIGVFIGVGIGLGVGVGTGLVEDFIEIEKSTAITITRMTTMPTYNIYNLSILKIQFRLRLTRENGLLLSSIQKFHNTMGHDSCCGSS